MSSKSPKTISQMINVSQEILGHMLETGGVHVNHTETPPGIFASFQEGRVGLLFLVVAVVCRQEWLHMETPPSSASDAQYPFLS